MGAQRQYSGTAGRIENCQIGIVSAMPPPMVEVCWTGGCTCPRSGLMTRNAAGSRECLSKQFSGPSHNWPRAC